MVGGHSGSHGPSLQYAPLVHRPVTAVRGPSPRGDGRCGRGSCSYHRSTVRAPGMLSQLAVTASDIVSAARRRATNRIASLCAFRTESRRRQLSERDLVLRSSIPGPTLRIARKSYSARRCRLSRSRRREADGALAPGSPAEPNPQLVGRGLQPGLGDTDWIVEALASDCEDPQGLQIEGNRPSSPPQRGNGLGYRSRTSSWDGGTPLPAIRVAKHAGFGLAATTLGTSNAGRSPSTLSTRASCHTLTAVGLENANLAGKRPSTVALPDAHVGGLRSFVPVTLIGSRSSPPPARPSADRRADSEYSLSQPTRHPYPTSSQRRSVTRAASRVLLAKRSTDRAPEPCPGSAAGISDATPSSQLRADRWTAHVRAPAGTTTPSAFLSSPLDRCGTSTLHR
jgi:hypothetical protein